MTSNADDRTHLPLITMDAVTLRHRQAHLLPNTSWQICSGQHWVILGPNGSGKSTLARAVQGNVVHVQGTITRHVPEAAPERIGYLSFELQEELFQRAEGRAESLSFSGRSGPSLTAAQVLGIAADHENAARRLCAAMRVEDLLDCGIRSLSNGEMRKVLIIRALLKAPKILILDEPFAGLDTDSRETLAQLIGASMARGTQVLLVTGRMEEILPGMTHVLVIGQGRVLRWGRKDEVLRSPAIHAPIPARAPWGCIPGAALPADAGQHVEPLVAMENIRVAYGDIVVLAGLTWRVRQGVHWAIVGPNGSGKSTLLGLITGENLQVYANEIRLFGRKRGEGDSLWEIRRRIGVVSPELQLRYRRAVSVKEAVLSGFFDTIGLYRKAGSRQEQLAAQWLACIGLRELTDAPFLSLSYGQKRLVLVARAMVKSPELLLLDEPCQGLDPANRTLVLGLMEEIGRLTGTTILFVTHHPAEILPCIQHVLRLEKPRAAAPLTSPGATAPVRPACPAAR